MSDLECCFIEYFNYLTHVIDTWRSLVAQSSILLQPLINQTEQLRLCSRAQLDEEFLLSFPNVKEKLLGKINLCVEEEMISIYNAEEEIKTCADSLSTRLNSIEKAYENFDPDEEKEFNPLIPSNGKLLEYATDTWKYFHTLWLGVKTSIETVDYYEEETIKAILEAFLNYKKLEGNIQYVANLTQHLKTSPTSKEP